MDLKPKDLKLLKPNIPDNEILSNSHKHTRESIFKLSLFDNSTGRLISKYNWEKYKAAEDAMKKENNKRYNPTKTTTGTNSR